MEFLSNKPLLITDTILRDAHQSQAATRMTLEQMLPACEILDSIGYYSRVLGRRHVRRLPAFSG